MGSQPRSVSLCKKMLAKRAGPGSGVPWQQATLGPAGWKAMVDSSQTDPSVMSLIKTIKAQHGMVAGRPPSDWVRSPSRRKY